MKFMRPPSFLLLIFTVPGGEGGIENYRDLSISHLTTSELILNLFYTVLPCDNIPDILNGKRSPVGNSVICGTKIWYTCNEGFLLEGDIVLLCGTGGKLKGQVPVCRASGNLYY